MFAIVVWITDSMLSATHEFKIIWFISFGIICSCFPPGLVIWLHHSECHCCSQGYQDSDGCLSKLPSFTVYSLPCWPTRLLPTISRYLPLASLLGILCSYVFIAITDQSTWSFLSILQTIPSQHVGCSPWIFGSLLLFIDSRGA